VDLSVVEADIVTLEVDAIVNAANRRMRGGSGVDGAIHAAAGPELVRECAERFPDGLPTGQAGWTHGHRLPARWVIHVVGPNHRAGETDRRLLVSCYANALRVADEIGAASVAFPLVSVGAYGWPRSDAIAAAVDTLRGTPTSVRSALLVAFGRRAYDEIVGYVGATG
jgi:O-acetyl-ADP-ribose deacetylase